MDARTHRLLHAPIGTTLLRLAAPNVVVMLVQALVGLIETAFVAGLGTDRRVATPLGSLMTMPRTASARASSGARTRFRWPLPASACPSTSMSAPSGRLELRIPPDMRFSSTGEGTRDGALSD